MTIEVTPAVAIAAAGFFLVLFAKIWSLGARVEGTATRDEVKDREAQMRRDFEIAIKDRTKDSVQEHANLASKSALTEVKEDIFDFKKEVNNELKEINKSMNIRFQLISDEAVKTQSQLTKILHYVAPKGANHG